MTMHPEGKASQAPTSVECLLSERPCCSGAVEDAKVAKQMGREEAFRAKAR